MIVTHIGLSNIDSNRTSYETDLITLVLDKTRDEYGDYQLQGAPPDMTQARALQSMREHRFPNHIMILGFNGKMATDKEIAYVRFPTLRGIVGYRTCFTSPEMASIVDKANSLDDIRHLRHGQGVAWVDVGILRHNDFTVKEIANYDSLFKMTAANRLDVFCRGAHEILIEHRRLHQFPGLTYDQHSALYYPMPMLFFTHKKNKEIIARLELGLNRAYADGSLFAVWRKHFEESINFINMPKRRVFLLENPNLRHLDFDYEKYFIPELRALGSQPDHLSESVTHMEPLS